MKTLDYLLIAAFIIVMVVLTSGCSVTFRPDGSRTYRPDARTLSELLQSAARAYVIPEK
jgi:hypothetical protein